MFVFKSSVIGIALISAIALIVGFVVYTSEPVSGTTLSEAYKENVRDSLGELSLRPSNNLEQISSSIDGLSSFMNYRSGISINVTNKNLLKVTEQNFWDNSSTITSEDLKDILHQIAYEKIPNLTGNEIGIITESYRGFNDANLPPIFVAGRSEVALRVGGRGRMDHEDFSDELTSFTTGGMKNTIVNSMIHLAISSEIDAKINVIKESDPNFLNEKNLTAIQAVWLAYVVAADDQLLFDQAGLTQHMSNMHQGIENFTKSSYPSPTNKKAYGDNGYLFSSPLQILLSDSNMNRLITLIAEKGNR